MCMRIQARVSLFSPLPSASAPAFCRYSRCCGCANITDRFAGGFVHLHTIALGAAHHFDRIHRQDLVGWSFVTRASNYQLMGPPGWVNSTTTGGGPLTPHPDYFTSLLWKQNVGDGDTDGTLRVLNASSIPARPDFALHVFCASRRVSDGGAQIVYLNSGPDDIPIALARQGNTSYSEFLLTATASEYAAFVERRASRRWLQRAADTGTAPPPPASLFSDTAYLNGVALAVDASGTLPPGSLAGKDMPPGWMVAPPYSYGFFTVQSQFAACSRAAAD